MQLPKLKSPHWYTTTNSRLYFDFPCFSTNVFPLFEGLILHISLNLVVMSLVSSNLWQFLALCLSWFQTFCSVLTSYFSFFDIFPGLDCGYRFSRRIPQRWSALFIWPHQGLHGIYALLCCQHWSLVRCCLSSFLTFKLFFFPF